MARCYFLNTNHVPRSCSMLSLKGQNWPLAHVQQFWLSQQALLMLSPVPPHAIRL